MSIRTSTAAQAQAVDLVGKKEAYGVLARDDFEDPVLSREEEGARVLVSLVLDHEASARAANREVLEHTNGTDRMIKHKSIHIQYKERQRKRARRVPYGGGLLWNGTSTVDDSRTKFFPSNESVLQYRGRYQPIRIHLCHMK